MVIGVVYRVRHCPRCNRYLNKLNKVLLEQAAIMDVMIVFADTREKAPLDRKAKRPLQAIDAVVFDELVSD